MAKPKELTPLKRNIAIITIIALVAYSGYNAYLVVNAYIKLSANVGEFQDTISNWNSKVITDVVVAANCPTGYESAFNDRKWPGIDEGCFCGNVSSSTLRAHNITCFPFCSDECTSKARTMGCKDVDSKAPVPLTRWFSKGGSAQQICIKRSSDETFGSAGGLTTPDGNCPTGYTKCGSVKENVFCTKEPKCPISDIIIQEPAHPLGCMGDPDCFNVEENSAGDVTKILTFSRSSTTNKMPMSEIRLNEDGMCERTDQAEVTPGRTQFGLLGSRPSTCRGAGTYKWTVANSITEEELFTMNGLQSYIEGLYIYPDRDEQMDGYYKVGKDGSDYKWRMFSRGYIEWKMECRGDLDTIVTKSDFITKLKTGQLALLIIGMMSTAVLGLVLSFIELMNLRGVDWTCIDGKGEEERKKIQRIKKFINYGFKLVQIPFQIWAITLTISTKDLFSGLADKTCSTPQVQGNFDYLAKTLNSTFQSNVIAIGVLGGSIILDLVLMCCEKKEDAATAGKNVTVMGDQSKLDSSSNALNNTFNQSGFPENPFAQNNFAKPPQSNFAKPPQNIVIQIQNPSPQTTVQPMPGQYPQQFGQPQPQVFQQNPPVQMPQPFAQPQPQPQFGMQPQYVQTQPQFVQPQPQYAQPQYGQPQFR